MGNIKCKDIFKKHNIKYTKQRELIFNILKAANLPLTVEDIFLKCKNRNKKINLSTVYRIIDKFVSNEIVVINGYDDKKAMYELNRDEHKHLLTCLKCNHKIVLDKCPLDEYKKSLSKATNFEITSHNLSLYGYCASCKES